MLDGIIKLIGNGFFIYLWVIWNFGVGRYRAFPAKKDNGSPPVLYSLRKKIKNWSSVSDMEFNIWDKIRLLGTGLVKLCSCIGSQVSTFYLSMFTKLLTLCAEYLQWVDFSYFQGQQRYKALHHSFCQRVEKVFEILIKQGKKS
jgi:hypothetical protein